MEMSFFAKIVQTAKFWMSNVTCDHFDQLVVARDICKMFPETVEANEVRGGQASGAGLGSSVGGRTITRN